MVLKQGQVGGGFQEPGVQTWGPALASRVLENAGKKKKQDHQNCNPIFFSLNNAYREI